MYLSTYDRFHTILILEASLYVLTSGRTSFPCCCSKFLVFSWMVLLVSICTLKSSCSVPGKKSASIFTVIRLSLYILPLDILSYII